MSLQLPRRSLMGGAAALVLAEDNSSAQQCVVAGPVVTGGLATVTFSPASTGQFVPATAWGVATGFLINDWGSLGSTFYATAKQASIAPNGWIPFLRLNAASGASNQQGYLSGGVFVGGNTASPNWSFVTPFFTAAPNFLPPNCPVTIGATIYQAGGSTNWTTTQYQSIVTQAINEFVANGINVFGVEISNEEDNSSSQNFHSASTVASYFSAMVAGIAASNKPSALAIGPVTSYANASYIEAVANAGGLGACCYHMYVSGSAVSDATMLSIGGNLPASPTSSAPYSYAASARSALKSSSIANPNTLPLMMGEWNYYDIPGVSTQQSGFQGAVSVAVSMILTLNADPNIKFGGIWELLADQDYGIVQSTSSTTMTPSGYVMAVGSQVINGQRGQETVVNASSTSLLCIGVYGGRGSGTFGVMLVNFSTSTSYGPGTIGLSRWPVNNTGTATIYTCTINSANPTGLFGTASVSAGLVTVTIPAATVLFLFNPAV